MANFFSFALKKKFPNFSILGRELKRVTFLSMLFFVCAITAVVVLYATLWYVSSQQSVVLPTRGGSITEGVIGAPRFINPLLAVSPTDTHLVSMLYSGLVTTDQAGNLVPDLAMWSVSPDNQTYTFTIAPNTKFSDGSPLTTDDVLFTYNLLQNGLGGETLQNDWRSRTFTKLDQLSFSITTQPNDHLFLSEARIGILPKKYWGDVAPENFKDALYNTRPIGSGPSLLKDMTYENGIPHFLFLERNQHAVQKPYLEKYQVTIFPNQEDLIGALDSHSIDMTTALPTDTLFDHTFPHYSIESVATTDSIVLAALPSNSTLADPKLHAYIDAIIDKAALLATIDSGYGLIQEPNNSLPSVAPDTAKNTLLSSKDFSVSPSGTLLKQGAPVHLLLVVESNSKEALMANFIKAKLADAGIETEVRNFDTGIFRDLIAQNTAPAIIATSSDIPIGYSIQLPLYTRTAPVIINKNMSRLLSQSGAPTFSNLYTTTPSWFIHTERLWKWFIKKDTI